MCAAVRLATRESTVRPTLMSVLLCLARMGHGMLRPMYQPFQ